MKGCLEYLDSTVEVDRIIVTVRKDPSLDERLRVSLMLGLQILNDLLRTIDLNAISMMAVTMVIKKICL